MPNGFEVIVSNILQQVAILAFSVDYETSSWGSFLAILGESDVEELKIQEQQEAMTLTKYVHIANARML